MQTPILTLVLPYLRILEKPFATVSPKILFHERTILCRGIFHTVRRINVQLQSQTNDLLNSSAFRQLRSITFKRHRQSVLLNAAQYAEENS